MPKAASKLEPGPRLNLTDVFDALRDPIRREIVRRLASAESLCASFADLGSASGLSYHFARLRTAGLTNTRKSGTCRLISLRKEALESQLPGVLASVLQEAGK
jgi:DNA-binding transcriptional ArsR family regulator